MNRRSFCLTAAGATAFASLPKRSRAANTSDAQPRVLLGVDYYPDQTPETSWPEDARMMAEAGMNNVRIAEFAWALMEPSEGRFEFDWLRRSVRLLHAHGIDCILGTPSAAPPPWLTQKYPEVLLVNSAGVTMSPGSRRFTCPTNELYRRLSCTIATEMARSFSHEPGVIGWQIDNELTLAEFPRCFCRFCRAGFAQWLLTKYGSLDAINKAWGTVFWSQVYTDPAQIPVPLPTAAPPNPGLALDYDRYQSEANIAFLERQLTILRSLCPEHFITTNNVAGLADKIDLRGLYRNLDFASADSYPAFAAMMTNTADITVAPEVSFSLDAMRAAKEGKPFLVMEEQSGKSGQPFFSPQPQRGQVRLWTYQAVAHGAMGINYFRWNTATFGAEEYWHGLLNHDRSKSPAFAEAVDTLRELKELEPELLHAPVVSQAAISFDPVCDWAVAIQPGQRDLRYGEDVTQWYSAMWESNVGLDCVDLRSDLQRYKLVLVPMQYVLSPQQADMLIRFVDRGGTAVVGYRSGVKTDTNQVIETPRPGLLRKLIGATLSDYVPIYARGQSVRFAEALAGDEARCELWYDVLQPETSEVLATYTEGDDAGKAAITRNRFGQGHAYYLGSRLEPAAMSRVLRKIAAAAGAEPPLRAPKGVEVTVRGAAGRSALFVLNHTGQAQTVPTNASYRNLLGNAPVGPSLALSPYGVAVLART